MNKEDLIKLYRTLVLVETKGESTKIMAQCLQYIEQQVQMLDANAEICDQSGNKGGETT